MRRLVLLATTMTLVGCGQGTSGDDAGGGSTDASVGSDVGGDGGGDGGSDAAEVRDGGPTDDAFVVGTADALDVGTGCPARRYVGLFVWNDDLVTSRDAILDLADGAGVTEIYLHANLFYAGDESESTLAAWIDAAHARCISVDLLFGNASWIHPAGRSEATARAAWVAAYASAHAGSRPAGVHFDLEPQQLPEWSDTTMQPALAGELVDTLAALRPTTDAAGLSLTVDVGFFLDGVMVTRGSTRPASEWVTDEVTRLLVMDYRDSAESMGHGGMISLAQDEVDYAATVHVPVVLAAETGPVSPEYVTFAEEGRAAMLAELDLVRTHFAGSAAFLGVAIHDRDGLEALPP